MNLALQADWEVYLALLLGALAVNGVFFSRAAVTWLDPLLFVMVQSSLALVTVLFARFISENPRDPVLWLLGLQHAAFLAGLGLATRATRGEPRPAPPQGDEATRDGDRLRWVLRVSTAVLLAVLLARLAGTGLFLFAEDPEIARVQARTAGGAGYLYRLTYALSLVNVGALVALALHGHAITRRLRWAGWGLPVLLTATTGAKAELVLLYAAAFATVHAARGEEVRRVIRPHVAAALLVATLGIFAFAMTRRFASVEVQAESGAQYALAAFLERVADAGAGLSYYLANVPAPDLARLGPLDFLWNYVAVPFLAPFRLADYPPTLGNVLAREMIGDDTFGPNPTMYMEGLVYFGTVGGVVYCAGLGALLARLRALSGTLLRAARLPYGTALVISAYWAAIALNVTVDFGLMVSGLFNFVFVVVPVLAVAHAIARRDEGAAGAKEVGRAPASSA